jgi:glycosidase
MRIMIKLKLIFILGFSFLLFSCGNNGNKDSTATATIIGSSETFVLRHPTWSKNATIYEVNVRQHTPSGTFKALELDLPRLQSLGIDILWIMPINPIGQLNRKGSLGSYYSVKDYRSVNPEYGNLGDFKSLVDHAHSLGMHVIIDWVANHTSWDHSWITEHPDWYVHDSNGAIVSPVADWSDVADLNYDNKELRAEMIESMKFWITECGIDGFRCDVAMMVPTDFWDTVRKELDQIKPVFMLAEAEQRDHHLKAFDMCYSWEFLHIMNEMAKKHTDFEAIDQYLAKQDTAFPKSAIHMYFTTNHDENTWNGTGSERYGSARKVYDVLAFTLSGMPLLYSGQENNELDLNGKPHRYLFFDKDTIQFNNYPLQTFYSQLLKAHHECPALWNGEEGGTFQRLHSSNENIYAFTRKKGNSQVVVLLNFSSKSQQITLTDEAPDGVFNSIFDNKGLALYTQGNEPLGPYGYQVFIK